jgi:hypothetical protein
VPRLPAVVDRLRRATEPLAAVLAALIALVGCAAVQGRPADGAAAVPAPVAGSPAVIRGDGEAPIPVAGETRFGPYLLERVVLDRWVHEGQHPGFVAYDSVRSAFHIRGSVVGRDGTRQLTLKLHQLRASLRLQPSGRILSATIDQPPITYSQRDDDRVRRDNRRRRLIGEGATLSLPTARFWEVPFVAPDVPLVAGLVWSDTLSFAAEGEGLTERLDGVWEHRVVGDSVIGGRSFPLIETTAALRYRSRELTADVAFDVDFEVVRDVAGTLRGRAAIDPQARVRAAGADSVLLSGTAVLRMGDGAPLTSAVSYDRRRLWVLRDSVEWAALEDSLRERERREGTGMLRLPRTRLEERLRAGDAAAADSLLERWRATSSPNERAQIGWLLLRMDARGSGAVEDTLRRLRLGAGDSATVIASDLASIGRMPDPSRLLPYLDEPARLWRLGILPRWPYYELAQQLVAASPIIEPDSTRWPCRPDACAAVLRLLDVAAEPRLRDAALAGAFARDPARWHERVVARADSGSIIARNAALLGAGVAATWPAASRSPLPVPGASWRSWLDWMGGTVRWDQAHRRALRMYTARTGRDPLQELLREWPPAEDSARLVVGTVLRGAGRLGDRSAAELREVLLAGPTAERRRAQSEVDELLRRHGTAAPDPLAVELLQPLLDPAATGGVMPWADLDGDFGRFRGLGLDVGRDETMPVFVLDENLPADIAAALPAGFTLISREAWAARPQRAGGVLVVVNAVLEWDGFARVQLGWTAFRRRGADEAPSGYAGGGSLTLLRTTAGWRTVSEITWIT